VEALAVVLILERNNDELSRHRKEVLSRIWIAIPALHFVEPSVFDEAPD